ncbi:hypothetical protein CFC21_055085 [Triticum aestivum]|uniref:Serpin domain-containing protein n=2 Tax=Triticum aestivum TaxID=4565 RepID=A0A9R1K9P1_WHEAT|nr:hypothetical protein CFC21_055085 [Triticum aestivum]
MDWPAKKSPQSGSGLAQLAAGLTMRLADENPRTNLVFSPLSIYTALSLLAAGARDTTLDEILRILGARSCGELESFVSRMAADALQDRYASGGPRVAFACGVWSDLSRPLKPAFREAVVGTYKAEASTVNFRGAPEEARGQINAWAAQITRVVLGNAMYFKGKWEDQPFDRRHTMHEPFYRLDRSQVDVPFMQSTMSQFVAVHDGFKVLKLRYKCAAPSVFSGSNRTGYTQFSMCIFLPDAHDGLWGLLDTIASRPRFLHDHLPEQQIALREFRMPKFKMSFHSSIVAVLKKLGLELPFCERGNLSDMVDLPVVVGDVIHKAVVEVNEEGTEAAAVMDEATGAVVFAGHFLDPSKE